MGASSAPRLLTFLLVPLAGVAGCGLTLDYDPPTDAGADVRLDAPRMDAGETDAGDPCGGCPDGRVCVDGACHLTCTGVGPCSDDPTLCERCIDGLCQPAEPSCTGGSECRDAFCDPMTDGCRNVDTCPTGMACSVDVCVPAACTGDVDCEDILGGCGYVCTSSVCTPRDMPVCPVLAATCEVIDPCTCLPTGELDPELCGLDVCDPVTSLCVECVESSDCSDAAGGRLCDTRVNRCVACIHDTDCGVGQVCDSATGSCVECVDSGDCRGATPVCDVLAHECVSCLDDDDCPRRCDVGRRVCVGCLGDDDCDSAAPICDRTTLACRTCRDATGDCGIGEMCMAGRCVPRGCTFGSDCPAFSCAGPASCIPSGGGACTYAGLDNTRCNDGIPCTQDICDPSTAVDGTGCIHLAIAGACDDDIDCTEDFCRIAPVAGEAAGCRHVPNDARCSSGTSLECATSLCVANEPGAIFDADTGCGLSYEPRRCPVDEYCDASGACESLPGCSVGSPCPPVGTACLDPLICVAGTCRQIPAADTCDTLPTCATYCSSTGCMPRDATTGGPIACSTTPIP